MVFVVPRKPAHIGGARFVYALGGDPVARVAFHEPDGLPSRLVHRVTLPVGRITIAASLSDPSGRPITKVERSFQVPAQGDVRVDLGSKGTAHAGVGSAVAAPASGDAP